MGILSQNCNAIKDRQDSLAVLSICRKMYDRMASQIFNTGGLVIGSGSKKAVKLANTIYGIAGGVPFTKTTAEATLAAVTITNAKFNVCCVYVDKDGTFSTKFGKEGAALVNVIFPVATEGAAMLGYVILNPTGTGNFVGATTDLDDGTVVPNAVYVNTVGPCDPSATI